MENEKPFELRPEVEAGMIRLLQERLKKSCEERGITEIGTTGIDLTTAGGLALMIAAVEKSGDKEGIV